MNKFSLCDVTFIIPIRIDSCTRASNLLATTYFLTRHFNTNIFILEASNKKSKYLTGNLDDTITYEYRHDIDPIFFRTKYINYVASKIETPYIAIWDADVIAPVEQIIDCIQRLRCGEYEVAYPYDGRFIDVYLSHNSFKDFLDVKKIKEIAHKMFFIYGKRMKGGGVFVKKKAYVNSGMENTKFYGWGSEDNERYIRWEILNYKIYRAYGVIYHLWHPRGINSCFHTTLHALRGKHELLRISYMSRYELIQELEKWKIE